MLDRQEIFDSAEATNWFARLSNTLHVRTRPAVIERELLFKVGQPYDSVQVAETARNLRSLGIFREVRIDSIPTDSGLVMHVTTRDAWTTRPGFNLRTVGGQVAVGVSFADDNFLGTATGLGVSYSSDPVRTNFALSFDQPRLLGHSVGLAARWENRSDGTVVYGTVGRPFYSITSPLGFQISGEYRDETVLQYLDGVDVPVDSLDHLMGGVRTSMAWALRRAPRGYIRAGVLAQIIRNDYQPTTDPAPIPRTVTGAVGGYGEWAHSRFLTTTGFQSFSRTEDVNLSTVLTAGVYAAPGAFGYDTAGVGLFAAFQTGASFHNGFVLLNGLSDDLITSEGTDSGGTVISSTVVWTPGAKTLVLLHGEGGWLTDPAPGYEFDLGLNTGPRAFGVHSFTGNRAFFTSAEVRRLIVPRAFNVMQFGLAVFGTTVGRGGAAALSGRARMWVSDSARGSSGRRGRR